VLCNLIVLWNCVKELNCVVENLVEKGKIKLFVLFYNEGCKAICYLCLVRCRRMGRLA
jgi:hypothetical protein